MENKTQKKILLGSFSVIGFLLLLISLHIYMMTRKIAPGPTTIALARIDLKQPIADKDKSIITSWLYQQKGVSHVMMNASTKIIVFSFFPAKVNADILVKNLKNSLHYNAVRFKPTVEQMSKGCPAGYTSSISPMYQFIKNLF